MNVVLSIYLVVHGFGHLGGFVAPWRFWSASASSDDTTIHAGRFDVGQFGMRVLRLYGLAVAIACFATAWWAFGDRDGWPLLAGMVTAASLILHVLTIPDSRLGLLSDAALVLLLAMNARLG